MNVARSFFDISDSPPLRSKELAAETRPPVTMVMMDCAKRLAPVPAWGLSMRKKGQNPSIRLRMKG
ncbi:hypothetical protein D3C83_125610 [compost metagenome]